MLFGRHRASFDPFDRLRAGRLRTGGAWSIGIRREKRERQEREEQKTDDRSQRSEARRSFPASRATVVRVVLAAVKLRLSWFRRRKSAGLRSKLPRR